MKTFFKSSVIALAGMLSLGVFNARSDLEVSASVQIHATADFQAPLAQLGSWVDVHSYGRCWRPARVAADWRPYCNGQWEWTDAGWYWVSDEPWAWACYHYGNWVFDSTLGWVWVPGVEWAPAWVYWRVSDRYVGWAPCPPRGLPVAPEQFAFVEIGRFHDHVTPSDVIVKNASIIRGTREITQVKRENRSIDGRMQQVVVNQGPDLAVIQKAVGTLKPTPIRDMDQRTHYPAALMRKPSESKQKPLEPTGRDQTVPLPRENRPPQKEVNPSPTPSRPAAEPPRERLAQPETPSVAPPREPPAQRERPAVAPPPEPPAQRERPAVAPPRERPAQQAQPPEPPRGKNDGKEQDKEPKQP